MDIVGNLFARAIDGLYFLTENYGTSVLCLAAIIQLAIVPLKMRQKQNTKKLYKAQKEVNGVKKNFKGTPKELEDTINRIYEKHNAGKFSGCILFILTLLIPMIVFLALYKNFTMPFTYFCNFTPKQTEAVMKAAGKILPDVNREYEAIPAIIKNSSLGLPSGSIGRIENLYSGFFGINLCEKVNLRNTSGIILLLALVLLQSRSAVKDSIKKTKDKKFWISQAVTLPIIAFGIYIACQLPAGLLLFTEMATAIDHLADLMYRKKEMTQ